MNDKVVLYYFPLNGRAGIIRALLTYLNIPFEDKHISKENWPELKNSGKFEFAQMPALEMDGKIYVQTLAIESYISRKYNLLGSNEEEEYQIFSLLCSRDDYSFKIRPIIMPITEKEKNDSDIYLTEFFEFSKKYFKILEKRLSASGGKYLVGNKFSLADIYATLYLFMIFKQACRKDNFESLLKENSPIINNYVESIRNNELKQYFDKVFNHDSLY